MVSIIIPNYNHLSFIQERLDSVFNQTYQDFEVILLDDKSTDGSEKILLEYANHPKVSYCIINEDNSGSPFKQWKKGIELARGEFIWIAESDDVNDVYFLENTVKLFDDGVGVVFTALKKIENQKSKNYSPLKDGRYSKSDLLKFFTKGNLIYNASGVLFLKESLKDEYLETSSELRISGDWSLYVKILENYDIAFSSELLSTYNKHSNSTSFNLFNSKDFYYEVLSILSQIFIIEKFSIKEKLSIYNFWRNKVIQSNLLSLVKTDLLMQITQICGFKNSVMRFLAISAVTFNNSKWQKVFQ